MNCLESVLHVHTEFAELDEVVVEFQIVLALNADIGVLLHHFFVAVMVIYRRVILMVFKMIIEGELLESFFNQSSVVKLRLEKFLILFEPRLDELVHQIVEIDISRIH